MLAHHYLSTLELGRAAGRPADALLEQRALEQLREAGARAFSLNAYAKAASFFEAGLELAPVASLQRAHLLFELGRVRHLAGDIEADRLMEASAELLAHGDPETAAEAEVLLADLAFERGIRDTVYAHLGHARDLVKGREASRVTAYVLSSVSRFLMLAGEYAEAIRVGREALAVAAELGLDEVRAHALITIGTARVSEGGVGGMQDLEQGEAIALAAHVPGQVCRARHNMSSDLIWLGQLELSLQRLDEAAEAASRFGQTVQERWERGVRAIYLFRLGRWDEALAAAEAFLVEVEAGSPHKQASNNYAVRAEIRFGRGDLPSALADAERALELARLVKDPQELYPVVAMYAYLLLETGNRARAAVLADEFLAELQAGRPWGAIFAVHQLSWTLSALGRGQELCYSLRDVDNPWARAAVSFAAGDLREAADICATMGAVTEEARDRLWLAQALIKRNRRAEGDVHLQRALAFYRPVAAPRYVAEGEALLAASA